MEYSRKGWWLSKTATWVVVLGFIAVFKLLHPAGPMAAFLMLAMLAIIFPLGMRTFFYRDEIERQTRMRCWFFGCQIGVVITGLAAIAIFFLGIPAPDAITSLVLDGRPLLLHGIFRAGFSTGVLVVALPQAICALLMRAYLYLPKHGQ